MLFVSWLRARCKRARQSTARRGGVQLSTDGVGDGSAVTTAVAGAGAAASTSCSTSAAADAAAQVAAQLKDNELKLAHILAWRDDFVMRFEARRSSASRAGRC